MIYLDNAATSYPKPPQVVESIVRFLTETGGSPARSSHRMALAAARVIYRARENVAHLVGLEDPLRIILTPNATIAINLALRGMLSPGDHVITTGVEHNSVMRPLRALETEGIELTIVPCSVDGFLSPDDMREAVRPNTAMVVMTHASNVLGSIEPISEVGEFCREMGILLLVDAAQTLGSVPTDVERDCADLMAFSGHKSLYGPQGTGGLILGSRVETSRLKPVIFGGTGSRSESEQQPEFLPDLGESGTLNGPGIAGLAAGVEFVLDIGVENIRRHEMALTERLIAGLLDIPGVTLYGPKDCEHRTAVVSFNIDGLDAAVAAFAFDERYGIMCRAGLHCAPAAHKTAGTFPSGSIRFGLGYFQTESEIETAISAVRDLSAEAGNT